MRAPLLMLAFATLYAHAGYAIPPAPRWVVSERPNGLDISLSRAPWTAFPLEDGTHTVIRATGAALTREVGWPELPAYHLLFAVPPGCEPVLRSEVRTTDRHALRAAPVGVWSSTDKGLTVQRSSSVPVALTGELYPPRWATIEPWGRFRGVQLYAVDIRPLQQRLGTAEIVENVGMSVEISWDPPSHSGHPAIESRYLPVLQSMVVNDEFASLVGAVPPARAPAVWEPPYPAVKITVPPGRPAVIHREDLAAAAPDLAAMSPEDLSLSWKGAELPCIVETSGDTFDRISFLSPPLPVEYANETFHNVMWLGRGSGLQSMSRRDATPLASAPEVTSHPATLTVAEELEHSDYTSAGDALQWWWSHVEVKSPGQTGSTNVSVGLSSLDKTRPVTLTLTGSADTWTSHRLRVSIAGHMLADTTWTNRGTFGVTAAVPAELVFVGTNVVKIEAVGQTTTTDRIWIKSVTFRFFTGTAAMDSLRFAGATGDPGRYRYRVEGFRYPGVTVLDASDPEDPVQLTGHATELITGGYALTFGDSTMQAAPRQYVVFAPDRGASRPTLESRVEGVLGSVGGADYLVVTHPLFADQASRLASYRESRGLTPLVVDVNEVFDRFGWGYPSSRALDDFVAWAYASFDPRPGFVVLVGDGSARQRHGNETSPNLIPVRLVSRVADENAYADVDDDPHQLPDLAIGRLSVQTAGQAAAFIDKIIAAETQSAPSPAHARIALFADDASGSASQPGFAYDCEQILASVSPAYFPERIYLSYNGGSNDAWNDRPTMLHSRAKGEAYYRPWILDTIRDGVLMLTYVGHGGVNTWATEWIITTDDAPEMLTAPNYPFMTSFSCDTGRFDDPDYDIIMAEHFTRWREGALAFFSSSRESYPSDNSVLSANLHQALLDDGVHQIGLAIQVAKFQSDISYVCRTYSLLRDPASELPVPSQADLTVSVVPEVVTDGTEVSTSITWSAATTAEVSLELADAFGIPLAARSQSLPLPWTSVVTTAEAPPPGEGVLRVYARSGAQEALAMAPFTSPVNIDTAEVTPEYGSGGAVASNNGNILVSVPPGCVDDTTVVRITVGSVTRVSTQSHMDVCPVPGAGTGRAYQVRFDSGELGQAPLSVRMAYDTNWVLPVDVDSLMAAMWDPGIGLWVGLPSTVAGGRVEAEPPTSGQFTILVVYDREPPIVTHTEIQDGSAWRAFQEGEFAATGDWMRFTLADHDGILGSSVHVRIGGQSAVATFEAMAQGQQEARVLVQLPEMPSGTHTLALDVSDVYGNPATHTLTVRLGADFVIAGFAAVPNPFPAGTTLRFVLSADALRAVARVYTVSGRLIREIELANPVRGTNLMAWDGLDQDGDRIAGGVYLVRLQVDAQGLSAHAETKVVRRPA